jgi:ribonuclease Z
VIPFDVDLDPISIADRLSGRRRVLLFGPPGSGKSTLAAGLAAELVQRGISFSCIGADPGSPAFGVPGAVSSGQWRDGAWVATDLEPLCSLDAARFRLPLIQAIRRLIRRVPKQLILLDAPGVVRGTAAAELLAGIVAAAEVDTILLLQRGPEDEPLRGELRASAARVVRIRPADEARRPAKNARDLQRTILWNDYVQQAFEHRMDLDAMALTGTPPPLSEASSWAGRQIALIDGDQCVAFGESLHLDGAVLYARLCGARQPAPRALLIRDAARDAAGFLRTAGPIVAEFVSPSPPDMSSTYLRTPSAPQPEAHAGAAVALLVNGVFGDPLLHIRLQHQKRSLLFDLGETTRLPARIAHQVTDVFITHAHIDHIAGFVWLLRSRIGSLPVCRIYGPPGLAENIMGFISGIHWDRAGDRAPQFEISELRDQKIRRYRIRAGQGKPDISGEEPAEEGVLLRDCAFQVRGTTLDHRTPVLAFVLEMKFDLNVRRERLAALGWTPGRWLSDVKAHIASGERDTMVALPDGTTQTAGRISDEILILRPGPKLAYATDLADTIQNRTRLQALAEGAHTFFCEAHFCEADIGQSVKTGHLTTRACGEIAAGAQVERLVPFHFSRRYEDDPARIYEEVSKRCSRTVVPWRIRRRQL